MPSLTIKNLHIRPVVVGPYVVDPQSTYTTFVTILQLEQLAPTLMRAKKTGKVLYSTQEDPQIPDQLEGATVAESGGGGGGSGSYRADIFIASWPGPIPLGTIPAGSIVDRVALEITQVFNNGVQMTLGEPAAMARFLAVTDSRADKLGTYTADSNYLCPIATLVSVYFVGAIPPTTGTARAIVYYL